MFKTNNKSIHWNNLFSLGGFLARVGLLGLALAFLTGWDASNPYFNYLVGGSLYAIFFAVGFTMAGSLKAMIVGAKTHDKEKITFGFMILSWILFVYIRDFFAS